MLRWVVLGSILLLPEVCDDIASLVKADDFYDDANRCLYHHMREMYDSGEKIDSTLLVSRLRTAGDYEKVGGMAYPGQAQHGCAQLGPRSLLRTDRQ